MPVVWWFKNYFYHTETYSTWRFILEMGLIINAVKIFYIAISLVLVVLVGYRSPQRTYSTNQSKLFIPMQQDLVSAESAIVFFGVVIIIPFLETFIGQIIPIKLVLRFTKSRLAALIISVIFFILLHENNLLLRTVTVVPSIVFAWSFMVHSRKSFWHGVRVTTLLHMSYNLLGVISNLL